MPTIPLVLLLLATLARCSPLPGVKCDGLQETQHGFDLGPLMSCSPPSGYDLQTECPNVNYSIPEVARQDQTFRKDVILSVLNRIEDALRILNSAASAREACRQAFRNELCSFYFPRCSDDHCTVSVSFNCTRVKEACPGVSFDFGVFCPKVSPEGVYPIEPCRQKEEEEQVRLDSCAPHADLRLPSWLLVHTKAFEGDAQTVYAELNKRNETCAKNFLSHACQSVGRCWSQGCRLERSNSKDQCSSIDSCMQDTLGTQGYNAFAPALSCGSLSPEKNRPATATTPITSSTATPSETTTTTQDPMTSEGTIPVIRLTAGAGISLHSVSISVLLLAVLSCLSLF